MNTGGKHNLLTTTAFFRFEIIIVFLSLIIRIGYAYYTDINNGTSDWNDDFQYLSYANSISKQGILVLNLEELNTETVLNHNNAPVGYGSSIVGPILPLVIYILLQIGGTYKIVYIFNALLGALSTLLLIRFGKRYFSYIVGLALGLWFAINPDFIRYTPHLLKEPLLLVLVFLQFSILLRLLNKYSFKKLLFLCLISFTIVHLDERYIAISAFIGLIILFHEKNGSLNKRISRSFLYILLFSLSLVPWSVRNYYAYNQVVLLTERTIPIVNKIFKNQTNDTWNLKTDDLLNPSNLYDMDAAVDSIMKGYQVNSIPLHYTKNIKKSLNLGNYPRKFSRLEKGLNKLRLLFTPSIIKGMYVYDGYLFVKWSFWHNLTGIMFYGIFIPFIIIGLVISFLKKNLIGLLVFYYIIIHALIHLLSFSVPRYRTPIDPILMIGAVLGITWVMKYIKNRYVELQIFSKKNKELLD